MWCCELVPGVGVGGSWVLYVVLGHGVCLSECLEAGVVCEGGWDSCWGGLGQSCCLGWGSREMRQVCMGELEGRTGWEEGPLAA